MEYKGAIQEWIDKYGTFDRLNQTSKPMEQTKDQKMMELEQKVKLLERQNARLEKEIERKDLKADFFDMMIEIAEKEYKIDIRKKCLPEQSTNSKK